MELRGINVLWHILNERRRNRFMYIAGAVKRAPMVIGEHYLTQNIFSLPMKTLKLEKQSEMPGLSIIVRLRAPMSLNPPLVLFPSQCTAHPCCCSNRIGGAH